MRHLDEGTIHAWLDGALGLGQAGDVEAHVAACAECAERVAEARGFIAASSRILAALDHVPADVVPVSERRVAAAAAPPPAPMVAAAAPPNDAAAGVPRSRWGLRYARLAAVIAFVVAGTLVVARESERDAYRKPALAGVERARADSTGVAPKTPARAPEPSPAPPSPAPAAPPPTALGGATRRGAPARTLAESQTAGRPRAATPDTAGQAGVRAFDAARSNAGAAASAVQASSTRAPLMLEPMTVAAEAKRTVLAEPRLVASDTVRRGPLIVRRETYQVGNDQVVLEALPPTAVPNGTVERAAAPAPSDSAADSSRALVHVIQWRGADGTNYTLSGPVSTEALEHIRAALGKQ